MIDKSSQPDVMFEPSSRSKGSGFAIFIAALALFFTVIGIGAGYRHWQRMNIKLDAVQAIVLKHQEQLINVPTHTKIQYLENEIRKTFETQKELLDERLATAQALEQQTRQFATTVAKQTEQITRIQGQLQQSVKPSTAQAWQVAEVQFLLKLAIREWQIAQNKTAALAALKEADQLLVNLGAVEYLPTRQQIASDMGILEKYQGLDAITITQKINDLRKLITPPKPLTSALEQQLSTSTTEPEPQLNWWQEYSQEAKELFNESFTIRQTDKILPVILDTETSQQIYQLTLIRLEALQLVLLQGNWEAAQEHYQILLNTFTNYYPEKQAKGFISTLSELQKITEKTDKPDISGSLKALNQVVLTHNANGVKP